MKRYLTSTTERIILWRVSAFAILLTPYLLFFNVSSLFAQKSPSSEVVTSHKNEYISNTWSQDKWFTTLDTSIQQKYLAAYKNGDVSDADMSMASRLSINAHKIVQYGPSVNYPSKIRIQIQNKINWDRRADLEAGGSGNPSIWPTPEEGRKMEEQLRSVGMIKSIHCANCGKDYEWIAGVINSGGRAANQCPNCGWVPQR